MDSVFLIELAQKAILLTLKLSLAPMLIALVVGVGIGLLQALTQIQEATLSFVPKLIIMLLSIAFLLPFLATSLIEFTNMLADKIVNIGQLDR